MKTSLSRVFGQRSTAPISPKTLKVVSHNKSRRKTADDLKAVDADQRKYRRIRIRLAGRFMREDQQEFPCYTTDISAGGMNISTSINCEPGEYIVFYIEEIGRIEGFVVRNHDGGFAVAIEASTHKRERLVATLTWLLNRHELEDTQERRFERQIPTNPHTTLVREDGSKLRVKVLDLSLGGARIDINTNMKIGEKVYLGKSSGVVVRCDNDGVGIQFDTVQSVHAIHSYFG